MSRKKQHLPHTLDEYIKAIIKELEVVTAISGWRRGEVYDDFLEALYYTLRAEPDHERALAAHEPFPTPPEDEARAFGRLRHRYGKHWPEIHTQFAHAMGWVRMATAMGMIDVLGPVFEQWGAVNVDAGQFFTPPDVAELLVRIVADPMQSAVVLSPDGVPLAEGVGMMLAQSIEAAIAARPLAALMAFFGQAFRATASTHARLVDAAASLLELDRAFARRLDAVCAESVEAFMILTLGEAQGRRPDEGQRPLDHAVASLLDVMDPLGRNMRQLVTLSPSAQILHLWIWTLRMDDRARQHWLLGAIARIIGADADLAERLSQAITDAPELRHIAPGRWDLDVVSDGERHWLVEQVIFHAYAAFEPVGCYDPAAGACTLLLHMAKLLAEQGYRYAVDLGFIRFYGQEKDHRVWQMGASNVMLHGLNGHRLKISHARTVGAIQLLKRGRTALLDRLPADAGEEQIVETARLLCQVDLSIRAYQDGEARDQMLFIAPDRYQRALAEVRSALAGRRTNVVTLEPPALIEAAA
jgi:hypothetical protein